MRRWVIVNVLLGLVVALLAGQIALTWGAALRPVAVAPRPPTAASAPAPEHEKGARRGDKGGPHTPQTPEAMVATVGEKDLFDPSRRGPSEDAVAAAAVPRQTDPPPGVTLVGVSIIGHDREAFMNDPAQGAGSQRRLRLGDDVGGYTVKAIEPDGVTLSSPSGDLVTMALTLEKGKAPTPGRPATPVRNPAAGATSPAAGVQTTSPAAGSGPRPPTPVTTTPPRAQPVTPQAAGGPMGQNLPSQVRNKLEQLKARDKGTRAGSKH